MPLFAALILASTLQPIDLNTLQKQSPLVVVGYVTATRTTLNAPAILEKRSALQVISVLRGSWGQRILHVRTRTGLAAFDRHLKPGDNGVFFLTPLPNGDFEAAYPGSFALFEREWFKAP